MTDAQKFGFYLPVWNRLKAARFKFSGFRLAEVIDGLETEIRGSDQRAGWPEPAGPLGLQVITFARQLSNSESRKVTAEDLRHACTIVATAGSSSGPKESSKRLNNTEVNRVVTLFRLLIDPDDLRAVTDWLHPEDAQKKGLIDFIRKLAPEGLLRTIYSNAYGTMHWEDGNRQQLVWLLKQVKGRQKEFHAPLRAGVARERDLEMEPF